MVLLDVADRMLLMLWKKPFAADGLDIWITPGGGAEASETFEQAARRELVEEIGLNIPTLGPCVWTREYYDARQDLLLDERFFLVRVETHEVNCDGMDLLEQEQMGEHRWWTADELLSSTERFAPSAVGQLLSLLLAEGAPSSPISVGK